VISEDLPLKKLDVSGFKEFAVYSDFKVDAEISGSIPDLLAKTL
jgi:predicted lipid carrier protein YhbT